MLRVKVVALCVLVSSALADAPLGRVCGRNPSVEDVAAAETRINQLLSAEKKATFAAAASPVIPVYCHVIRAGETLEEGNVPAEQVQAQIDVLNADYADTGLSFELMATDYTTNATWFEYADDCAGKAIASDMKHNLRQGGSNTLNVYSTGFVQSAGNCLGLLGYATFPSFYETAPEEDGVVIVYSSLPGGSRAGFDLGRTLTHEAGH